ncbi:MAG: hypothetical protein Q8N83_08265 [Ignavibacteria bacterium]|nr:hypothetical protein [Ignavibacteria bacterium]
MKKYFIYLILVIPFFFGCGDKLDLSQFSSNSQNVNTGGDTVYVQLSPSWEGFNNPHALIIGMEPFIYVCDTDNNRIVMLNTAGVVLGTKVIPHPIAIAQDYRLNLIVCSEFDTLGTTFSAVYKIDLFAVQHNIENAPITRILPRAADFNYPLRKYTAVAAFYDNSYFVARNGPNNTSVYDPDNSILKFQPKKYFNAGEGDSLIGRVPNLDPLSSGLISANGINCMTPFKKKNVDFIATFSGETSFKSQWFHFFVSAVEEKYVSQFSPYDGTPFAQPNKFGQPTGCCLDQYGNIFVADGSPARDSIYKFNQYGEEMHSFGGPNVFTRPAAVAFLDKTLYVLDAGSNKVLRFILSTDIR